MKKQSQMRAYQRSELNIGQAAKLVEKALIRLIKGTDERRKGISENQDILVPLQLVGFGATLHIFKLLIRITNSLRRSGNRQANL